MGKQPFFESDNQMFYTIVENVNYGAFPGHAKSSHKSEKVPIESSHKNENVPIESSHKEVKLGKTAHANTWSIISLRLTTKHTRPLISETEDLPTEDYRNYSSPVI